jgi:hypothetical protein
MRLLITVRTRVGSFVAFYLRHPAEFLLAAVAWWATFVVALTVLLDIPFRYSLETGLEIAFTITAPPDAVSSQYHRVHPHIAYTPMLVQVVGAAGWTVIVFFTFLIPALVAAMIERLPLTLRSLMHDDVWSFFERYSDLLSAFTKMMVEAGSLPPEKSDEKTAQLLQANRVQVLRAVASIATYWFRGQIDLNANASFLRKIRGADYADPNERVLYSDKPARDHEYLLELDGWAEETVGLSQTLLLPLDSARSHPGAPYAVVNGEFDVVSNAQDPEEWRRRGETPSQVKETIRYFENLQFRSFVSIPVYDMGNENVIGALTVHVDKPKVLDSRNPETADLVETLGRFRYFLAWLERRSKNG